jgi:hypothetical protein
VITYSYIDKGNIMPIELLKRLLKLFFVLIVFFMITDGILFYLSSTKYIFELPKINGLSSLFRETFLGVGQKCEKRFLGGRYFNDPEIVVMFDEYLKNFTLEEHKRLDENPLERKKLYEHFLREVVAKKYHLISNVITYD